MDALNGKLAGARVATIEYGMKDVVISEIALATLRKIERVLMSEKDCDDEVNALLSENKKVCSGYSSLTASIVYKVRFDRNSDATAQAALTNVIKKAIEETGNGKISVRNAEEFVGENLIYGILLSSRCIVIDTTPGRTSGAGTPPLPAQVRGVEQTSPVRARRHAGQASPAFRFAHAGLRAARPVRTP